jgi:molybdopterin molybdotransferase
MRDADLITVEQAIAILDSTPVATRTIQTPLIGAAGLVLAQDLTSDRDFPPFDKSLVDGFAVRSTDILTVPVELNVIGEIAAGQTYSGCVGEKQTIAIMTGAPLPVGADAVVMVEDTETLPPRHPGDSVRIGRSLRAGQNISRQGDDCRTGKVVLNRGAILQAAQIGVAASVGATTVSVFEPPGISILSTGDEVVPIDAIPGASQIRNSNSIMFATLLSSILRVRDIRQSHVKDDPKQLRAAIEDGLRSDVLFITGGMSMGRYDYVPGILKELGVELKITKLRIKPGKPFVFGTLGNHFVFGLPGNPVSGFVCTLRLASRMLRRMVGIDAESEWLHGRLVAPLSPNGDREFYQPGFFRDGVVTPLKWKGSADVFTLASANVLIVRPENAPALAKDSEVRMLEIPT